MIIPFSQNIMYGLFGGSLILVVIGIMVLSHHWGYYGIKGNKKVGIKTFFYIGIGLFILIEIILIALYNVL